MNVDVEHWILPASANQAPNMFGNSTNVRKMLLNILNGPVFVKSTETHDACMNDTLAMQRHAEMQLMSLCNAQTRNSGQEVRRVDTIEVVEIATHYPQSVKARRIQNLTSSLQTNRLASESSERNSSSNRRTNRLSGPVSCPGHTPGI